VRNIVVLAGRGNDQVTYTLTGDMAAPAPLERFAGLLQGLIRNLPPLPSGLGDLAGLAAGLGRTGRGIAIELGDGDDQFTGTMLGRTIAAGFNLGVHGGTGQDKVGFAATDTTIADRVFYNIGLVGGRDNDTIQSTIAGVNRGRINLAADGGMGNDQVDASVTTNDGSTGRVNAVVRGGDGDDQLKLALQGAGVTSGLLLGGRGTDVAITTGKVRVLGVEPTPTPVT
jgi:hypothetical protein